MTAPAPFLDHLALGTRSIDAVAESFTRRAGAREIARFTEASWRGLQVAFAEGIRLEALEPIESPRDDFLVRFLEHRGEGPHHVTFKVPDIRASIEALRAAGFEPVKVDLTDPNWMECFLHPRCDLGTVVQLAQPSGRWAAENDPGPPPGGARRVAFLGAEIRADSAAAEAVFGGILQGTAVPVTGGTAYSWAGGGTLVCRPPGERGEGVERVVFRVLSEGDEIEPLPAEEALYNGPSVAVHLGAAEGWPG